MPTWLHSTWAPSTPCYIAYIVGCHFANEFAFAYYYSAVWICHLNQQWQWQCHQRYNYQITTEFVRKYLLYFRLRQLQFIIMRIWELVALRRILCTDVVTAFATGRAGMQFLFLFFVAAVVVGGWWDAKWGNHSSTFGSYSVAVITASNTQRRWHVRFTEMPPVLCSLAPIRHENYHPPNRLTK